MGSTRGVPQGSCFPPSKAGRASLILCELMAGSPAPSRQCGRVSGIEETIVHEASSMAIEVVSPHAAVDRGLSAQRLVGPDQIPSQVKGHTPDCVGTGSSTRDFSLPGGPREALERVQGIFLCSVLCPSLCAHMCGRQVL